MVRPMRLLSVLEPVHGTGAQPARVEDREGRGVRGGGELPPLPLLLPPPPLLLLLLLLLLHLAWLLLASARLLSANFAW